MSQEDSHQDCIFCRIAEGATPADVVFDGGDTIFFRDISPKARVHIVGIPKKHITSVAALTEADHDVAGKLLQDAAGVAQSQGISDGGYRIITNAGDDAGQVVKHWHIHVLGGERLGPLNCPTH